MQRLRVPDAAAQALSQPNPAHDDALAEAAMHAQAALHQTGALPAMGAVCILQPRTFTVHGLYVMRLPQRKYCQAAGLHAAWPASARQALAARLRALVRGHKVAF